jgi:hypothetical protein|tara:strand:+ start:73 stop:708 length:636 start_codon:yes stop_codon:yes gene_type:complete
MPDFICPTCQQNINVEPEHLGMAVSCPLCGSPFKTPVYSSQNRGEIGYVGNLSFDMLIDDDDAWYSWHSRVAGLSFSNKNGVSRQLIAQNCQSGEHITMYLEANNPHTPNAKMLCRSNGEQLGYFPSETGSSVQTGLDEGYKFDIYINYVTGGTYDKPSYGINLFVIQFHVDVAAEAATFAEEALANERVTPLYRPSPNLLERTEVRRIFT